MSDDELRERLSEEEYQVTQCSATEPAFTGKFWDHASDGAYHCVVCDARLFASDSKYESGSGWPSFWEAAVDENIEKREDTSHGMVRTEVVCGQCGAHLGHLFPDGPEPTGQRYCINSAALTFEPA